MTREKLSWASRCAARKLAAEVAVESPDEGAHEEEEAEEDGIGAEHEDGGEEGLAGADDGHEDDVLDAEADGLEIGGHAADDAADFHLVEEGGGQPLEMDKDGVAHVADDEFAKIEGVEDAVAEGELGEGGQGGELRRRRARTPRKSPRATGPLMTELRTWARRGSWMLRTVVRMARRRTMRRWGRA